MGCTEKIASKARVGEDGWLVAPGGYLTSKRLRGGGSFDPFLKMGHLCFPAGMCTRAKPEELTRSSALGGLPGKYEETGREREREVERRERERERERGQLPPAKKLKWGKGGQAGEHMTTVEQLPRSFAAMFVEFCSFAVDCA